jgi:hypothetical protein
MFKLDKYEKKSKISTRPKLDRALKQPRRTLLSQACFCCPCRLSNLQLSPSNCLILKAIALIEQGKPVIPVWLDVIYRRLELQLSTKV